MCSRSLITKCNCRGLSARTLSTGRPTPNSPNLRRGAPKPLPRTGGTQPRFGPFSVCGFLTCRHLPLEHVSISQTRVRASTTLLPLRKRLFRRPSTMSRRPSYTFSCRTKKNESGAAKEIQVDLVDISAKEWESVPSKQVYLTSQGANKLDISDSTVAKVTVTVKKVSTTSDQKTSVLVELLVPKEKAVDPADLQAWWV